MSDKYYVRMKFIIAIYLDFAQRKFASEKFPTAEILYFHVNIPFNDYYPQVFFWFY